LYVLDTHTTYLTPLPTRRSSDLWFRGVQRSSPARRHQAVGQSEQPDRPEHFRPDNLGSLDKTRRDPRRPGAYHLTRAPHSNRLRSEEHTSELQSRENLVCRLLLE